MRPLKLRYLSHSWCTLSGIQIHHSGSTLLLSSTTLCWVLVPPSGNVPSCLLQQLVRVVHWHQQDGWEGEVEWRSHYKGLPESWCLIACEGWQKRWTANRWSDFWLGWPSGDGATSKGRILEEDGRGVDKLSLGHVEFEMRDATTIQTLCRRFTINIWKMFFPSPDCMRTASVFEC